MSWKNTVYVCTNTLTTARFALRNAAHAVQRFTDCVSDISDWMSASRLILNPTKTEVMWLGSNRQLSQITISVIPLQSAIVRVSESACDLGIVLDCKLIMSEHVSALCRSGFYHLRQLRLVTRSLTPAAAQTVVQAFISCRLDHCNSLLYGISENLMRRVQSVQNAAARLPPGARRRDHISPVLSPALASGPEADRLQAGVPCSLVTGWTSSSLPRR